MIRIAPRGEAAAWWPKNMRIALRRRLALRVAPRPLLVLRGAPTIPINFGESIGDAGTT
jgi:hypothetical protein